jgi:glycosyltransferase involved in cell wall biosynthesis
VRVLIDYRPALRERTGAGEYTHELVKALLGAHPPGTPGRALELTLFSSSWTDRLTATPELAGAATIDRRIPVRALNFAWHRLDWPAAETLAGGVFDVTHSSHPLLLPARAAAQLVTIHDLDFLSHPERTRAEIRRDYPALARDHARRADAIIVPSAFTAGEVERRLGVPRDRIAVCPPGAPDWAPRAAAPKDGYVLFFGTLEPRKNVGGLLDAYEQLLTGPAEAGPYGHGYEHIGEGASRSDAYVGHRFIGGARVPGLVLAGKATADGRGWLERIEKPPLNGVVRHIGYVDPADRRALYSGARLLVLPSFDEGFGMPVLEAMSLGVPVVAANRGSLPEVIGDAGPLVNPERPVEIANAIARVLNDEAYASSCTARGLARARAFRWDRTAHRVYETYRQAIERRALR